MLNSSEAFAGAQEGLCSRHHAACRLAEEALQHLREVLRQLENDGNSLHPLVRDSLVIVGGTLDVLATMLFEFCRDSTGRRMYRPVSFEDFRFHAIHDVRLDGL